jgi:glycosyltransferase involved in cell wall biosynthesis
VITTIRQHHLIVLPTTGENFGHSIFEAMQAGRPVLISDKTPWQGLREKNAGWDLSLSDPELFTKAVEDASAWTQKEFDAFANGAWNVAHDFISNPALVENYKLLFA